MRRKLSLLLVLTVAAVSGSPLIAGDGIQVSSPPIIVQASPYWGYIYSPYGDVIRAQGDFLIKHEQARLLREKVSQAKLVTRKRELEHIIWERDWRYRYWSQERAIAKKTRFEAAIEQENAGIASGWSLNVLRQYLIEHEADASSGLSVAIPSETLAHIHVTSKEHEGCATGLLKSQTLPWPYLLRLDDFAETREQVERLYRRIRKGTAAGRLPGPADMDQLLGGLDELDKHCVAAVRTGQKGQTRIDGDFILAKRFLTDLRGNVEMLKDNPKALRIYCERLPARNVAELIAYMKTQGLEFDKALRNDERFYHALHLLLVDEVKRIRSEKGLLEQSPGQQPG